MIETLPNNSLITKKQRKKKIKRREIKQQKVERGEGQWVIGPITKGMPSHYYREWPMALAAPAIPLHRARFSDWPPLSCSMGFRNSRGTNSDQHKLRAVFIFSLFCIISSDTWFSISQFQYCIRSRG